MPVFRYEALNTAGKIVHGTFTGEVLQDAEQWLLNNGLTPVEIQVYSQQKDSDLGSDTAYTSRKATFKERLLGSHTRRPYPFLQANCYHARFRCRYFAVIENNGQADQKPLPASDSP